MVRHEYIAANCYPVIRMPPLREHAKSHVHGFFGQHPLALVRIESDEVEWADSLKKLYARRAPWKLLHLPRKRPITDPTQACSRGYTRVRYRTFFTRTALNRPMTGSLPTSGLA